MTDCVEVARKNKRYGHAEYYALGKGIEIWEEVKSDLVSIRYDGQIWRGDRFDSIVKCIDTKGDTRLFCVKT